MTPNRKVLFGLGLENGVHQVSDMLGHARLADDAGLDLFTVSDHPYFADRLDAYAALGFVLGTTTITGAVIMTNLLSRPAPILARTVTGLSTISGGRVLLGIGAGGMGEEIVALGVPGLSPAARIRALEEAITVLRALGRRRSRHLRGRVLPGHRADTRGRADATDLDRSARPEEPARHRGTGGRVDTRTPRRLAQHGGRRVPAQGRRNGRLGRERPG
jgi:alkanesulfonate monooxygenase SsuD/methylene tetrahydromethanopterin reductase-like flavin-dependent oxidoreductase (luciferase family)